jgi:thiol-disulfide isomerase/thioredoxin
MGGGGNAVTLEGLLAFGKPVLLLFVSPTCAPCKALLPYIRAWERDYDDQLTIALLSKGTPEENEKRIVKYGARHLLLLGTSAIDTEYQATWTPGAVIVGLDGRLATKVTYGDLGIRTLVNHAVTTGVGFGASEQRAGAMVPITVGKSLFKIGERAPRFALPDLDGREVQFGDLLDRRGTLLLFWDPACRFCQAMKDDLQAWQRNPPPDAPALTIIAAGNFDEMRAQRGEFTATILLDDSFEVGTLYGASVTPSAVLVDSGGRMASSLGVGTRNVLALAGARPSQPAAASV